jgi:hypothetical protein
MPNEFEEDFDAEDFRLLRLSKTRVVKVYLRDILYICAEGQKKVVHVAENRNEPVRRYLQNGSFLKYRNGLDTKIIPQVGKGLFVNINAITRMERDSIIFDCANRLDVPEVCAERINNLIGETRETIPAMNKNDKASRNGNETRLEIHPIKMRKTNILVDNLVCVFSMGMKNIIRYYDRAEDKFVDYSVYGTIHSMPAKLPSKFCFAHKFFGLNLEWIKETGKSNIIMEDGNSAFTMNLPAKLYRKEFLNYYSHLVVG